MSTATITDFSHVEFNTRNLKQVITFFTEVLGMPLRSLQWQNRERSVVRAFMGLNENASISFISSLTTPTDIELGITHSANPGDPTTTGTVQHVAFNVDTVEDLIAVRNRIRAKGVHCLGPMDHGFCQSVYLLGPDKMALEVATLTTDNIRKWIAPDVVEKMGINQSELIKLLGTD